MVKINIPSLQTIHRELLYPYALADEMCRRIHTETVYGSFDFDNLILSSLMKRVYVLAMPILAAVDLVAATYWLARAKWDNEKKICKLDFTRSLKFFLCSIPLTPLALIFPKKVYLSENQWKHIINHNNTIKSAKQSLKKASINKRSFKIILKNQIKKLCNQANDCQTRQEISEFQNIIKRLHNEFNYPANDKILIKTEKRLKKASIANTIADALSHQNKHRLSKLVRESIQSKEFKLDDYYADKELKNKNFFPEWLFKLNYLKKLDIHGERSKATSLPSKICKLSNLRELKLQYHWKLEIIPSEIGQLSNLETLDLGTTKVANLPSQICQLAKLQTLSLSPHTFNLSLEVCQLPNLNYLSLHHAQILSLPSEIGQLLNLKTLTLRWSKITILPPEIGQLSNLKTLDLGYSHIAILPPEIGQLSNLEELCLDKTKIRSLPSEIGQLSKLKSLNVSGNPELRELPLSLGQIERLTYIDIDGTQVSQEARDAILAQCRALREGNATKKILSRIETWKTIAHSNVDLSGLDQLDQKKIIDLNEWLVRLEITKDFNGNTQSSLAKTVCEMLDSVVNDKDFQELFFVQIASNLECCGDRAAMALNEIYTVWKLSHLPKSASIREKLSVMKQGAKTIALRAAIAKIIDRHQGENNRIEGEAVEIYLYYETTLKKKLNLLSAIEDMSYKSIGKRDWIDEASLVKAVNTTFLENLIALPQFEEIVKNDKSYQKECNKKINPIKDRIILLTTNEPQGVDTLSEVYLNWQHEIGELNAKMKITLNAIRKEWAYKQLVAD